MIWRPYGGTMNERLAVAAAVGIAASLVFAPRKRYLLTAVLLLEVAVTAGAFANAVRLGRSQNPTNDVYTALVGIGAINRSGLMRPMWIDQSMRDVNTDYFHWFWTGQQPQYTRPEAMIFDHRFDFGMADFPTTPGTIKITGPGRPEGQYIKGIRKFGFTDISPLQSALCDGREHDVIASRRPLHFMADVPSRGRYKVKFAADAQACEGSIAPASFAIAAAQSNIHVTTSVYAVEFEVELRGETLQIDFTPDENGFVVLDHLSMTPVTPSGSRLRTGPGALFLTRLAMPFVKVGDFGGYALYAVN